MPRTVENPNKRIIAQYPWKGPIRSFTDCERGAIGERIAGIRGNLPAVERQEFKFTAEQELRFYDLKDLAKRFAASYLSRLNDPTTLVAWSDHLAVNGAVVAETVMGRSLPLNVLEIGCRCAPMLVFYQKGLGWNVSGIEPDETQVKHAHTIGNYFVKRGIAQSLPFENGLFDLVISKHVFCSNYPQAFYPWANTEEAKTIVNESQNIKMMVLPQSLKVFGEISRVLSPGGIYISYQEDMLDEKTAALSFARLLSIGKGHIIAAQK